MAALVLAVVIVLADATRPLLWTAVAGAGGTGRAEGLPLGQIPAGVALVADRLGFATASLLVVAAVAVLLWLSSEVAVRAVRRREF